MAIVRIYKSLFKWLGRFWAAYGRARAIILSPYFHLALVVNLVMYEKWRHETWWTDVISSLPNLIGFTLSGYAILMSFGSESFRKKLSGQRKPNEASPFVRINSTFVHFIFVQVLAVVSAIIASAQPFAKLLRPWISSITQNVYVISFAEAAAIFCAFFGNLLFVYAWVLALAATMAVFRLSWHYDSAVSKERRPPEQDG